MNTRMRCNTKLYKIPNNAVVSILQNMRIELCLFVTTLVHTYVQYVGGIFMLGTEGQ